MHARDEQFVDALLVASRALVAVAARSLADAEDVTLPQYRALVVLSTRPGVGVTELAEALDIHPSTATRLCDRLVRKGLIDRVQATDDRRATELRLAADGRHLVETVTARRRRDIADIVSRLPEDTRAGALEGLRAFADASAEPTGVDLFGWHETTAGP